MNDPVLSYPFFFLMLARNDAEKEPEQTAKMLWLLSARGRLISASQDGMFNLVRNYSIRSVLKKIQGLADTKSGGSTKPPINYLATIGGSSMRKAMGILVSLLLLIPSHVPLNARENQGEKLEKKGERLERQGERRERRGERKERQGERLENRGEKIENRGERVENRGERLERRGEKTGNEALEKKGEKMERRGERIENRGERLDRIGEKKERKGERMERKGLRRERRGERLERKGENLEHHFVN